MPSSNRLPGSASSRPGRLLIISGVLICCLLMLLGIAPRKLASLQATLAPRIEEALTEALGRAVRIGNVRINLLGQITLRDAAIARGTTFARGEALTVPRATAHVNLLQLLWQRGLEPMRALGNVTLTRPQVEVNRTAAGRWDFEDVVTHLQEGTVQSAAWHGQVIVEDAAVRYRDAHGIGTATSLAQDLVRVHGRIDATRAGRTSFTVKGETTQGRIGRLQVAGTYTHDSGVTNLDVQADRMAVTELSQFLPKNFPLVITNGSAGLRLSALFSTLPKPGSTLPFSTDQMTAEIDLAGIGLRVREVAAPIVADTGRLRLVHDVRRYPQGSQLELLNVQGHVGALPVTLAGAIHEINLYDLAHIHPRFDVTVRTHVRDGADLSALLPTRYPQGLALDGDSQLDLRITGAAPAARLDGTLATDGFQARDVRGKQARVAFGLQLTAPSDDSKPAWLAVANVKQATTGNTTLEEITLNLSGKQLLTNLTEVPTATGTASARRVITPWGDATMVEGQVDIDAQSARLSHVNGAFLDGKISEATAVLPIAETGNAQKVIVSGAANYADIDIERLAGLWKYHAITGRGQGQLTYQIRPQGQVQVTTDLIGTAMRYHTYDINRLEAQVHLASQPGALSIALPQAAAITDFGTFTAVNGTYTRNANTPHGDLQLPVDGKQIDLHRFSDKIDGTATLHGALTGPFSAIKLMAQVKAVDGAILGRTFSAGDSELTYQAPNLRLRNITFTRPGMTLHLSGGTDGFDPRGKLADLDGTLTIAGARVDDILALVDQQSPWPIDGQVRGEVRLHVTEHGLTANGAINVPGAVVHLPMKHDYPLALRDLGLNFALNGHTITVNDLRIARGETVLHAAGNAGAPVGEPAQINLTFKDEHARLQDMPFDLFGLPMQLAGDVDVSGTLTGALDTAGSSPLTLKVTADAPQLAVAGIAAGYGATQFTYVTGKSQRTLDVKQLTIDSPAGSTTASGTVDLQHQRLEDVFLTASKIDLSTARTMLAKSGTLPFINSIPENLTGTANVLVIAEGSFTQPRAKVSLTTAKLAVGDQLLPALRAALETEAVGASYRWRLADTAISTPAGQDGLRASGWVSPTGALHIDLDLPRQSLDTWAPLVPTVTGLSGHVAGNAQVRGTVLKPQLTGGSLIADGEAAFTTADTAMPNHLRDIDIRLQLTPVGKQIRLNVDRFTAMLDREERGARPRGFSPGWVAAEGTVAIPVHHLRQPDQWDWNLYSKLVNLPIPAKSYLTSRLSGYLHLGQQGDGPVLTGVLFADQQKLRMPAGGKDQKTIALPGGNSSGFNPRLSLALQVGEGVRMGVSITSVALRPTPLSAPPTATMPDDGTPDLSIDRRLPVFAMNAEVFDMGTAEEMTGTWGAVTGNLSAPRLYARFEVDGHGVPFPLSLFSSVRNARGRVHYNTATGVEVVMGIPDTPAVVMAKPTAPAAPALALR